MSSNEDSAATLREMSDDQLEATRQEAAKSLFRLHLQSQAERLDVPSELKRNRRLIARIKTIQNQRQRAARSAAGTANEP